MGVGQWACRLVAQDVQREPAVDELTHPLLLARWDQALRELAELTTEALGIPLRSPMRT